MLDEVTQSLTEEYYGRGKYGAKITPTVEPLEDNRVRVTIKIVEGDARQDSPGQHRRQHVVHGQGDRRRIRAQDRQLAVVHPKNDRYSKQALEGDLEKLKSFYMDRGFADFRWDDVQVAISPDKRDIFVTISVTEGDAVQDLRHQARGRDGRARSRT